jgi:hypothetical protein
LPPRCSHRRRLLGRNSRLPTRALAGWPTAGSWSAPVSVLGDPRNPGYVKPSASVVETLGLTIVTRHASRPEDLDEAFAAAAAEGDQAMVVQFVALTFEQRWGVSGLAARVRMPSVYPLREYAEAGGLLSYGPVIRDNFSAPPCWSTKSCAAPSPPIFPSSSQPSSSDDQPQDREGAELLDPAGSARPRRRGH